MHNGDECQYNPNDYLYSKNRQTELISLVFLFAQIIFWKETNWNNYSVHLTLFSRGVNVNYECEI